MQRPIIALIALALFPAAASAQTAPAGPPPPPPGCDTPEGHQLDYWVGRWTVSPTAHPETVVAESLIEKLYMGCAVRENWMPLSGGAGGSLSAWVPAEHAWRQTWLDAGGSWVDFKGGWNGKALAITGLWPSPGHPRQLVRMSYSQNADGSVRQFGEGSDDDGKTWSVSFDLTYRPAKSR